MRLKRNSDLGLQVVLVVILVGVCVEGPDPGPLDDLVQDDSQAVDVPRPGEHPVLLPQVLGGSPQLALVILIALPEMNVIDRERTLSDRQLTKTCQAPGCS